MFAVVWDDTAFNQMNALVQSYPQRRAELALALRQLARELNDGADTWGESREHTARLGFVGPLSVLIRVDAEDQVAYVMEVQFRPGPQSG